MTDSPTNEEGESALVPLGMLATAVVLLLAMVALAGWAHFQLGADAKIPIHWNAKGEVDGYAGKGGLWFTPVSTAVLLVLLILGKQGLHMVRVHQLARLVEVVVDNRLRIDAHSVIDRGKELGGVHRIFDRSGACLFGLAVNVTTLDAGSANDGGVALGPVPTLGF